MYCRILFHVVVSDNLPSSFLLSPSLSLFFHRSKVMDSGNSGSMQSSSGGDEEHDSRAEESISALLNFSAQRTMLNSSQPPHHPPMFDSISTYLDNFSRSPPPPSNMNSLLNLDMGWARAPRSDDPNCTDMAGVFRSSSSTSGLQPSNLNNPCYMNPINPSTGSENGRASSSADQQNVVRSSKKRSRASRRAPTTVLTTDTTNFRAMVQEFTGIPAPPFSGSSFPRTRLDLFSSGSTPRSGLSDPSPPPYLLRPFVQKAPQTRPSFISFPLSSSSNSSLAASSSTMLNAAVSSSPNATNSTIMSSSIDTPNLASTNIYRLPSYDLGLPKHQRNLLNMQNPMSNFQSLLQSPPPPPPTTKYPSAGLSGFGGKSQEPMDRMGTLEGFSMNQEGVNVHHHHHHGGGTLANLISTDDPPNWGDGGGSSGGDEGGHLRPFDGNYSSSQRVSSCCKANYTASSSDFHVEKGSENNVASRGEGMVDSWICSSD